MTNKLELFIQLVLFLLQVQLPLQIFSEHFDCRPKASDLIRFLSGFLILLIALGQCWLSGIMAEEKGTVSLPMGTKAKMAIADRQGRNFIPKLELLN